MSSKSTRDADRRQQWPAGYKRSRLFAKSVSSANEFKGACPHCGGIDRFWIKPADGIFGCRQCDPSKDKQAFRAIASELDSLCGIQRPSRKKGGKLGAFKRAHQYRGPNSERLRKKVYVNGMVWQRHTDGGWKKGLAGIRQADLLYRADSVPPGATDALICEGERDADTAARVLGVLWDTTAIVSGPGGAGFAGGNLAALKRCARFRILYDADAAGRSGAAKMAAYVKGLFPDATVEWAVVNRGGAETPAGYDLTDKVHDLERPHGLERPRGLDLASELAKWLRWECRWTECEVGTAPPAFAPVSWLPDDIADALLGFLGGSVDKDFLDGRVRSVKLQAGKISGSTVATYVYRRGLWLRDRGQLGSALAHLSHAAYQQLRGADSKWQALRRPATRSAALETVSQLTIFDPDLLDADRSIVALPGSAATLHGLHKSDNSAGESALVFDLATSGFRTARRSDYLTRALKIRPLQTAKFQISRHARSTGKSEFRALEQAFKPDETGVSWALRRIPNIAHCLLQISSFQLEQDAPSALRNAVESDARVYPPCPSPMNAWYGDMSWIRLWCAYMGYALTADTALEQFMFQLGGGRNGKGLLLELMKELLGGLCQLVPKSLFMLHGRTKHAAALADIKGKHLIVADEVPDRGVDWPLLRDLSGGGDIRADRKYADHETFTPRAKILMLANEWPQVGRVNLALKARFVALPFDALFDGRGGGAHSFPKTGKSELMARLRPELPALCELLLHCGAEVFRTARLPDCLRSGLASEAILGAADKIVEFLNDCGTFEADAHTAGKDLYGRWKEWTGRPNAFGVGSQTKLTQDLKACIRTHKLPCFWVPQGSKKGLRGYRLNPVEGDQIEADL
ncbi:MAG: DUF5906 domain-containing protein [Gemmatimonadota bacterium]|nr:DUF5906 domain-containing protein [Gemmatimonadota bacterium]